MTKLKTSARSVLSSNEKSSVNKFIDPYGLHIEASMNYAIVVDKGQKALMAVDLESGERVVVSKSKKLAGFHWLDGSVLPSGDIQPSQ